MLVRWIQNRATLYLAFTLYMKWQDGKKVFILTVKAECLAKSFFPQVTNTDMEDIGYTAYPDPVAYLTIDIRKIQKAILKFPSQSTPGTDNNPNKILKTGLLLITLCLHWLFNSSFNLGYSPRHFQDSITIFFWNLGKADYHTFKEYRPIAILNLIAKIIDSIVANRLSRTAKTFELLPRGHMGGKKGASF